MTPIDNEKERELEYVESFLQQFFENASPNAAAGPQNVELQFDVQPINLEKQAEIEAGIEARNRCA